MPNFRTEHVQGVVVSSKQQRLDKKQLPRENKWLKAPCLTGLLMSRAIKRQRDEEAEGQRK